MAQSYIGKPISLISHSDIRYRGILAGIDPEASTIQLSNVYSMGTETRRLGDHFIPPMDAPYEYIIFRASEVKELAVDEQEPPKPVPRRNVHDDPAVMSSAPIAAASAPDPAPVPTVQAQERSHPESQNSYLHGPPQHHRRGNGPHQRGRAPTHPPTGPIVLPSGDFDFESSNARFAKSGPSYDGNDNGPSPGEEKEQAYNKSKSFFDTLSPGPVPRPGGGRGNGGSNGRGRGRGGAGRGRRDEERDKNVATFGEPGGVGLMGPGAYVPGYGGRRGGRGGSRRGRGGGEVVAAR